MSTPDGIAADIADHLPLRAAHKATAEARIEDALRAYADERLEDAAKLTIDWGQGWRTPADRLTMREIGEGIRALKSRPPKPEDKA